MAPVTPILLAELLPELLAEELRLMKGLQQEDWNQPAVRTCSVKNVAAHLMA